MSTTTPAQPHRREQASLNGHDASDQAPIERTCEPESLLHTTAMPPSYTPRAKVSSVNTPEDDHDTSATTPTDDAMASASRRHTASSPAVSRWRKHRETVVVIVMVLLISALIKSFVIQSFRIPSQSMENTLLVGDYVTVAMYDSTNYTHGDVVVFVDPDSWLNIPESTGVKGLVKDGLMLIRLLPQHSGHHLIKRVIGMPGDHVWCDGQGPIIVNGVALDETYLKPGVAPSTIAFDVVVPDGYVWVMGDNRANSADSRYHASDLYGGFVPMENIVGPATTVVWPLNRFTQLDQGETVFDQVPAPTEPAPTLQQAIDEQGAVEHQNSSADDPQHQSPQEPAPAVSQEESANTQQTNTDQTQTGQDDAVAPTDDDGQ